MEVADDPRINKIFWFMINQAIEWFPSEREFLRIGIEKASRDESKDIKEDLLRIAIGRFHNDMDFLRELYKLKLENRDAGGVAGVIKQMTQQRPDDIEPVYYGMLFSIVTARVDAYHHFRKLAVQKKIPANAPLLLDVAFEIMAGKPFEVRACLDEIHVKFGPQHYFVTLLEYVAAHFFSDDEKKVKRAKKALIDAIDQVLCQVAEDRELILPRRVCGFENKQVQVRKIRWRGAVMEKQRVNDAGQVPENRIVDPLDEKSGELATDPESCEVLYAACPYDCSRFQ